MTYDELFDAYIEAFGYQFPRMCVPDTSEEAVAVLIQECLAKGEPYEPDIPDGVDI